MNSSNSPKAVFLDRDGVINEVIFRDGWLSVPYTKEEFVILPSVPEALSKLSSAGFKLIVVTNQPNISRGELTEDDLGRIHQYLRAQLPMIDAIYYCPHSSKDDCVCKKPKLGMIEQAVREHGINIRASYVIGDRKGDIDMGKLAGVRASILIGTPATSWQADGNIDADARVSDLGAAAKFILGQ